MLDVVAVFGMPSKMQRSPTGDPLTYFTFGSIAYGFNLSELGTIGLFDLEDEAQNELNTIKLI